MRFEELPMLGGGHPIFGHVPEIREDRLRFVSRLAEDGRPLVRLGAPLGRVAMVNDPKVLAELLVERARLFEKSAMTRFTLYPLAGEGLFTSTGELWRKQRKVMSPIFHPAPRSCPSR
jgi:cytochrome P450